LVAYINSLTRLKIALEQMNKITTNAEYYNYSHEQKTMICDQITSLVNLISKLEKKIKN